MRLLSLLVVFVACLACSVQAQVRSPDPAPGSLKLIFTPDEDQKVVNGVKMISGNIQVIFVPAMELENVSLETRLIFGANPGVVATSLTYWLLEKGKPITVHIGPAMTADNGERFPASLTYSLSVKRVDKQPAEWRETVTSSVSVAPRLLVSEELD